MIHIFIHFGFFFSSIEKDKDKEGKEGKEEGESKRKSGLTVPGTLRLRLISSL